MADNDSSQTLQEAVNTGTDNRVRRRPFTVILNCPQRWDPGAGPLEVSYEVYAPNVRERSGRLRYVVIVDGTETTLYTMNLDSSRLRQGCYELTQSQRWDGTIRTGIDARIGQRITADLSLLSVYVEVWNTENARPGQSSDDGDSTNVQGKWDAMDTKNVEIDAIAEARWDRNWVIPDKNPMEPDKGRVSVTIKVKNVAEGTPVKLEVMRIGEVPDPESDNLYIDNSYPDEDKQPGMKDAVVRNGQVVVGADNAKPEVVFNQFDKHWEHPGNNFYSLLIGFGEDGETMLATERNYEKNEKQCLHMRFTVFIHDAAPNLPGSRSAARRLNNFFRGDTKYWRSYRMVNGPKSREEWCALASQFIVIFTGHAACWCKSKSHPIYNKGKGSKRKEIKKKVPRSKFRVDQNACPTDIKHKQVGGCGVKNWVGHQLVLGRAPNNASKKMRRKEVRLNNIPGRTKRDGLQFIVDDNDEATGSYAIAKYVPRFLFFADGCRTMLTTNLGEHFTENGTKYFHGWIYSVSDSVSAGMMVDLFKKWIKGTKADPAPTEFELDRFLKVYKKETTRTRGRRKYYARVMDKSGVLNPSNRVTPASTAEALQ